VDRIERVERRAQAQSQSQQEHVRAHAQAHPHTKRPSEGSGNSAGSNRSRLGYSSDGGLFLDTSGRASAATDRKEREGDLRERLPDVEALSKHMEDVVR
jgi:hypothetical protein